MAEIADKPAANGAPAGAVSSPDAGADASPPPAAASASAAPPSPAPPAPRAAPTSRGLYLLRLPRPPIDENKNKELSEQLKKHVETLKGINKRSSAKRVSRVVLMKTEVFCFSSLRGRSAVPGARTSTTCRPRSAQQK
jgi:hypothetical protein